MLCSAVQPSPATQSAFLQTLHLLLSFLPSFLVKTHWVSFCSLTVAQPTAPLLLYAMYKFGKRIRPNEDASQGQRFLLLSALHSTYRYVAVVDWMTDVARKQLIPICITADLLRLLCKAFKLLMIEKAYMLNEPQGNTFIMSMPDEISLSIMSATSQHS